MTNAQQPGNEWRPPPPTGPLPPPPPPGAPPPPPQPAQRLPEPYTAPADAAVGAFQGSDSGLSTGLKNWRVTLYADRLEATRKTGITKRETRTVLFSQITTVTVAERVRWADLTVETSSVERLVVTKMTKADARRARERLTALVEQSRAAQQPQPQQVTVQVQVNAAEHQLSECPRCGADVHPKMRKCPYCSKPLVGA